MRTRGGSGIPPPPRARCGGKPPPPVGERSLIVHHVVEDADICPLLQEPGEGGGAASVDRSVPQHPPVEGGLDVVSLFHAAAPLAALRFLVVDDEDVAGREAGEEGGAAPGRGGGEQ